MSLRTSRAATFAALLAACVLASAPLAAQQRASLAERVADLERQAAAGQGNVELLNQITLLRGEVQALRAELEELQRRQEQMASQARSQYLDLDGRLVRLEGGASPTPGPASTAVEAPAGADAPPSAASMEPAPSVHGDAEARAGGVGEEQDYLAAFDELKRGDYVASARAFEDFLSRHPDGTYAPNALYWLGESYYVTQNYPLAEAQFRAVVERYPTHDKAAGALLKVGLSQFGQEQFEAAAGTLREVVARYPGTDVARTADDSLRSMRLNGL